MSILLLRTVVTAIDIYLAYPKHVARPVALRAIEKAMRNHEPAWLLERAKLYRSIREHEDPQFTPHPSTWFNQERFNDDPSTWRSSNGYTGKRTDGNVGSIHDGKHTQYHANSNY